MNLKIKLLIPILLFVHVSSKKKRSLTEKLCACESIKKSSSRIINGTDVQPGDLPWVASLMATMFKNEYFMFEMSYSSSICTGTVINRDHVLFAAHCFDIPPELESQKYKSKQFYFLVAASSTHNLKNVLQNEDNLRRLRTVYKSPDSDIAVAKLTAPFSFANIRPACLLTQNIRDFEGKLLAVGYGRRNANSTFHKSVEQLDEEGDFKIQAKSRTHFREGIFVTKKLQMVYLQQVTEIKSDKLTEIMRTKYIIAADQNVATCFGDSGSPLHYFHNRKLFVVGVLSRIDLFQISNETYMACVPGAKSIYSSVFYNLAWIKYVVDDNLCL